MYIFKSRQKKQHLFNIQKTNLLACQHLRREIVSSDQHCLSYSYLFKTSSFQWDRVGWQHPGQKRRKNAVGSRQPYGVSSINSLNFYICQCQGRLPYFSFPCNLFHSQINIFTPQMLPLETCRPGQTTTPSYVTALFISVHITQKFFNAKSFSPIGY